MSMTRAEAIAILERRTTIPGDGYTFEQINAALDLALAALRFPTREMVERMRGEWVMKHRHHGGFRRVTGMDDMGEQHTITIDERCEYDDRYCSKCGKQSPDNFLNFCGYCGQPKTDEAVDILWKRWKEAIQGG